MKGPKKAQLYEISQDNLHFSEADTEQCQVLTNHRQVCGSRLQQG